jgi:hypothetical protein
MGGAAPSAHRPQDEVQSLKGHKETSQSSSLAIDDQEENRDVPTSRHGSVSQSQSESPSSSVSGTPIARRGGAYVRRGSIQEMTGALRKVSKNLLGLAEEEAPKNHDNQETVRRAATLQTLLSEHQVRFCPKIAAPVPQMVTSSSYGNSVPFIIIRSLLALSKTSDGLEI